MYMYACCMSFDVRTLIHVHICRWEMHKQLEESKIPSKVILDSAVGSVSHIWSQFVLLSGVRIE